MSRPFFGYRRVAEEPISRFEMIDIFDIMIEHFDKIGPLSGFDIPYHLASFYDNLFNLSSRAYTSEYQLKSFSPGTDPLRLVHMNAYEGLFESTRQRRRFSEFRRYKVYEKTGLNFDDWLQRPGYEIDLILDDLRQEFIDEQERHEAAAAAYRSQNGGNARDIQEVMADRLSNSSHY